MRNLNRSGSLYFSIFLHFESLTFWPQILERDSAWHFNDAIKRNSDWFYWFFFLQCTLLGPLTKKFLLPIQKNLLFFLESRHFYDLFICNAPKNSAKSRLKKEGCSTITCDTCISLVIALLFSLFGIGFWLVSYRNNGEIFLHLFTVLIRLMILAVFAMPNRKMH